MPRLVYPAAPRSDQVDDYHGTLIADPYRGLEDTDAPSSRAWIEAENVLTEDLLEAVRARPDIRRRLGELWNHPRAGAPWRRGNRWFQLRNSGLQDQDVLWTSDGPEARGRVLLDPNVVDGEGTTSLSEVSISSSGELAAIALSFAGSDWVRWRIRRVSTGEDLPDRIEWSKFSTAAWTADDAGFFYARFPEPPADARLEAPNRNMQLCYHRLGTSGADDPIVFEEPDEPEWGYLPETSEDGRTLIVTIWRGTDPENRIYVADLAAVAGHPERAELRPLLDKADAFYVHLATLERTIYLRTDLDAPLGRVIAIDLDDPEVLHEIVAEGADALETAILVGGRVALDYLHDAHHRLEAVELDGRHAFDVGLPGIGKIEDLRGRPEDAELFLAFESFAWPKRVLGVRISDGRVREVGQHALSWNPADFVTEQVFATSADGTPVPLFLSHRRDLEATGDIPTLLYGYGGFQIAVGPTFKPEWLAWMERGGLLAVASLRGGLEYGRAWYEAGRLEHKQNVFDDFAACARWLAASGWTTAARIGISGRSNGGLLVGASITQHPELFGAAIAEVGVMDMLRFNQFTIGWGWTSDYGSPSDPGAFATLRAYSPLHNIRPDRYPPTLITTGDHDDRVVPGHSLKFAATLQDAQQGDAPILVRIDTDAGHGVGKPISKLIDERADVLAFLDRSIGAGRDGDGRW
ncbi:MAG TPA: prolyl oligopeptidase family serine peptidase [Candidatus Limnocylindrales bacterium]|nr:prolyl oligopeptidase family serine peptidase [Candidatus Limnocylindrales bacterium]